MTIVTVLSKNLHQAREDFFLHSVLRIHEWGELLCEVYRLIDSDLGCYFLVLLEQVSKCPDHEATFCRLRAVHLQKLLVFLKLRQLRKEIMKRLDSTRAENLIEDLDFSNELPGDGLEPIREFGDVGQGNN